MNIKKHNEKVKPALDECHKNVYLLILFDKKKVKAHKNKDLFLFREKEKYQKHNNFCWIVTSLITFMFLKDCKMFLCAVHKTKIKTTNNANKTKAFKSYLYIIWKAISFW